jgi:Alginate export
VADGPTATRAFARASVFLIASNLIAAVATAQSSAAPVPPVTGAARPQYELLRDEEDWSFLADRQQRIDLWDPLKYIPLGWPRDSYLSLGGEVRQQYERFENEAWGSEPEDKNGYLLQRYMFHADLHVRRRFRAFVQLKSGIEAGRVGGPRPPDEDQVDLHQAFADIGVVGQELGGPGLLLRVGRQELSFGSQRLVAVRESPNVRQSFDAIRAIAHVAGWRLDVFASRPVTTATGIFDDRPDNTRAFWGVYTVRALDTARKAHVDLYYLGLDRDQATFDQGEGAERRHTVGTRFWGQRDQLDYNTEAVWQWGSFANGPIRAWTVASDTGWRLDIPGRPRVAIRADVTSGDADRNQSVLQTFSALFPKGAYFGLIAPLGPYNHTDVHPQVDLALPNGWTLIGDWLWFWRTKRDDGIYNVPGHLLRSGQNTQAHFVGQAPGSRLTRG